MSHSNADGSLSNISAKLGVADLPCLARSPSIVLTVLCRTVSTIDAVGGKVVIELDTDQRDVYVCAISDGELRYSMLITCRHMRAGGGPERSLANFGSSTNGHEDSPPTPLSGRLAAVAASIG